MMNKGKKQKKIDTSKLDRGAFTEWCKKQGFKGVTKKCIEMGKRSRSEKRRKQAVLAENFRKMARKKGKK